jgi:hypothetical protein
MTPYHATRPQDLTSLYRGMDKTTAAMAASSRGVLQSTREVVWDTIEKAKELSGLAGSGSILDGPAWGIGYGALQTGNASSRVKSDTTTVRGSNGGSRKSMRIAGTTRPGAATERWRGNNYIQVL